MVSKIANWIWFRTVLGTYKVCCKQQLLLISLTLTKYNVSAAKRSSCSEGCCVATRVTLLGVKVTVVYSSKMPTESRWQSFWAKTQRISWCVSMEESVKLCWILESLKIQRKNLRCDKLCCQVTPSKAREEFMAWHSAILWAVEVFDKATLLWDLFCASVLAACGRGEFGHGGAICMQRVACVGM